MKYRKLRITWSAACGITCVVLIALWMRSLDTYDDWRRCDGNTLLNIQSYRGELGIGRWPFAHSIPWRKTVSTFDEPAPRLWSPMKDQAPLSYVGIRWQTMPPMNLFAIRYWSPVLLSTALTVLPWLPSLRLLRWQFSLRTLLIVMSIIAAGLGLIMCLR
jgi:hypothetical protein